MFRYLTIFLLTIAVTASVSQSLPVTIKPGASGQNRILDVLVGDKMFTSFRYSSATEKPVLFPVHSPRGAVVTRGFPIDPRPGERVDHPHHVGVWFNFGSVNNIDFWNNSSAIKPEDKKDYGTVLIKEPIDFRSGKDFGEISFQADWVDYQSKPLVRESTVLRFSGTDQFRSIVRITTLTAIQSEVIFRDNKEGLLAIRVDRAFEEPITEPEVMIDAKGNPTSVPVFDNQGVNGKYRNSYGIEGGAAWGQRAEWVKLSAVKNGEDITIAMMDHRGNYGFPAHWHARTYGLFSVNNFGSRVFVPSDPEQVLTLLNGQNITLKHQILIGSTTWLTDSFMNKAFAEFNQ